MVTGGQEDDSYIDLPVWATHYPRWGTVHGRHHIPTVGTLIHHKRWYSATVRCRYQAADQDSWHTFATDPETLVAIITATTLAEARTLISLCLTDAAP
uniref:Uncharacterized protein n=3 Tax=unclassified Streptomyces TaxID=2593676 RepID=V9Z6V6_9ACTN|nr:MULTISPECIES: hypothetical protein [unclassified Streptomyces]AHE39032.1 hypothetical protein pFRL3_255 [Streptomyces sp. FR1]AHE39555.1 hypothetical protein pFRL4_322c [Streptomyces sp. F2]AHE40272.1 hypothetical protein pFRL6_185 [Streptomyces sp. F12]